MNKYKDDAVKRSSVLNYIHRNNRSNIYAVDSQPNKWIRDRLQRDFFLTSTEAENMISKLEKESDV